MVSAHEQAGIELGLGLLDRELGTLGMPPLRQNPDFAEREPFLGVFPVFEVVRPGAAPFRFVFSSGVDLWVGPFSEILEIEAEAENAELIATSVQRALRSVVEVSRVRKTVVITLSLPGSANPWLTVKVRGSDYEGPFVRYEPLAA
jgi:hypothetical protein